MLISANSYRWWDADAGQVTIQRRWPSRNPIYKPTDQWSACNNNGTATIPSLHAPIKAGSSISAHYEKDFPIPGEKAELQKETWPHEWGPMVAYMAPCNGSCDEVNATEAQWFKIEERGLYNGTYVDGVWGMTALYKGEPWTLTIPETLEPGNYLIRHELIVIHTLPIQFYMECAQLKVTGAGSNLPGPEYLVKFPGAYNLSGWCPSRI